MKRTFGFCILFFSLFIIFSCVSNNNALMKEVYSGYYTIAEEYFKMEKYAKAIEFYEKCLKDDDELTLRNVKYKLAQSYLKTSKWEQAKEIYEELLLVDSENTNIKTLLAYSYMKLENFDKAEEIYLNLINSQSLNQSSYKNLILLYIIKNDFEKAEQEITSYKDKFPLDDTISTIETELENQKKNYEKEQEELLKKDNSNITEDKKIDSDSENNVINED